MSHLTEEESRLVEPVLKKYHAIAIAVGETLAKAMTTNKHVRDVTKMANFVSLAFIAGAVFGYVKDIDWLLNLSMLLLFSYGVSVYAYKHVMQEKIERLFDKVDILMIDWEVEFGDAMQIQQIFPKDHIVDAGAGVRFDSTSQKFDEFWLNCRSYIYKRLLGKQRGYAVFHLEKGDTEDADE